MLEQEFAARAGGFLPPRGLRNAHLQSMFNNFPWIRAAVSRRARKLLHSAKPHVLECGAGVRLLGHHSAQPGDAPRGLIVLLHGWEGSADSTYVLSLGALLFARGYDVFRLNFRDHGPTHHLNRELFHSCRLDEVIGAVQCIQRTFEPSILNLAGFSLGGNFALRVAARAPRAGIALRRVIAVCPALNPHTTMQALENGPAVYSRYFINKWKQSLRIKQRHFPTDYDLHDILACRSITAMTDILVRRYTDIPTLDDYLSGYALVGETLKSLSVASVVIAAEDDPIVPAHDLRRLACNPKLDVITTRYGGHCGFVDRWNGERWLDRQVADLLEA